ncbi:hypothetical protein ABZ686_26870 [Streptomyces sp. NPDC006992]|uniref:hypothetical protein n=1 Tax=Streptomyces sp. NPDC006992 TaxID=3155601 RepID=UPI0033C03AF4
MTALGRRAGTAAAVLSLTLAATLAGCGSEDEGTAASGGATRQPRAGASPSASESSGPSGSSAADGDASRSPSPGGSAETEKKTRGTPKGGVPKPGDVDGKDADEVAEGALTAMWTHDTTVDDGPGDAARRTADAGWLTRSYARQLGGRRGGSAPGAQWQRWADHRAYTTVALDRTEDAAKPEDTDTVAWRQLTVTTTPHGRDGWTREPASVVAYVHLVRKSADAFWRVADVTVR